MRAVLLIVAVISFVVVLAAVGFFAFRDPCINHAIEEFRSPAGRQKVVIFERSCGATSGFSTQASLLPADSPPPKAPGNILIIDDDHGKVPVGGNGKIAVNVRFIDDSTLTLAYPAAARVFTQVAAKNGVAIHHERVSSGR